MTNPRILPTGLIAALLLPAAVFAQQSGIESRPPSDAGIPDQNLVAPADTPSDAQPEAMESAGQKVSDAAITTTVKSKLITNAQTRTHKIDVTTHEGVVMLSGRVDSEDQKNLAMRLANDTHGVKGVRSQLVVAGKS